MKKAPKKFTSVKPQNSSQEKASQSQKLPNIPRKIPEKGGITWVGLASIRTHGEVLFVSFMCGVLLMGIGFVGVELQKNLLELQKREALHATLASRQQYWRDVVTTYPDYKDAYFQLAIISYQLGESDDAEKAITKALEIDPNDTIVREFARKIRG